MTRKSIDRTLWAFRFVAVIAAMAVTTARGQTSLGVPGNSTIPQGQDQRLTHASEPFGTSIRDVPTPSGISPIQPTMTMALQARAHLPASTPVPPTEEIQVLDPNVDPMGRPAVKVNPTIGPDGLARVDIPPCVLVLRYYYTGDRSFQGPMLPGGPSIIVVNHPADGARLYLEVQMPPGAPRVIYNRHYIEFNYGVQSVKLSFGAHGRPKVSFRQGVSTMTKVKVARIEARQATARFIERTGAPEAARKVHQKAKSVASSTADRIHDVGKAAVTPVLQVVKLIPGINLLNSDSVEQAETERNTLVKQASSDLTTLEGTIPTVR
jgi:hypothetical protein